MDVCTVIQRFETSVSFYDAETSRRIVSTRWWRSSSHLFRVCNGCPFSKLFVGVAADDSSVIVNEVAHSLVSLAG